MAEAKKENFFQRKWAGLKKWFREMRSELKKVVWPSKSSVLQNTLVVILAVLAVGIFVWLFDAVGSLVVQGIIKLFH